jgi:predicted KAP-like P-loop ATPase
METLALILFIILLLNRKELNFLTSPFKKIFHKINKRFKDFSYKTYIFIPIYEIWEVIRNIILYWTGVMTSIFLWVVFVILCLNTILIIFKIFG